MGDSNNPNLLAYNVSNLDILRKIKYRPLKSIEYKDLYKLKSLLKLLPNNKLSLLVIYFNTDVGGHWTLLVRTSNVLSYCDSYGMRPDSELQLIPREVRQENHENHQLTNLLNNMIRKGFTLTYNQHKFQKLESGINTCGKYVISIMELFLKGMNLHGATQYLHSVSTQLNKTPDEIVNMIYNNHLDLHNDDFIHQRVNAGSLNIIN